MLVLSILLVAVGTYLFHHGGRGLAILLVCGAVAVILIVLHRVDPSARSPMELHLSTVTITRTATFIQLVLAAFYVARHLIDQPPLLAVSAAGCAVAVAVASLDALRPHPTLGSWSAWVLAGGVLGLGVLWVGVAQELIMDVYVLQEEATDRVLRGVDPYLPGYPNIYSVEASRRFFGPGLVSGNVLTFGFPYPPASLLVALPGGLVGDVRLAHAAALGLAVLLVARLHGGSWFARAGAVLLATNPMMLHLIENGWTELFLVAALAFALRMHGRGGLRFGAALGVVLALKQFAIVLVGPILWWSRRQDGSRWLAAATALGTAVVLTVPFVLWHPGDFWFSVVEVHARQPVRMDSLSLVVLVPMLATGAGSMLLPIGGVVCGLSWLRHGRVEEPWSQVCGVALLLLVVFLLAKQAFVNYYVLAGSVLAMGLALMGSAGPAGVTATSHPSDVRPFPLPPQTREGRA